MENMRFKRAWNSISGSFISNKPNQVAPTSLHFSLFKRSKNVFDSKVKQEE